MSYIKVDCFRPQQGLLIMNMFNYYYEYLDSIEWFPSPTGVTNYERLTNALNEMRAELFPSPTGVTNYEKSLLTAMR